MAVPDSSPRASVGVSIGIPQMLLLDDGTFFPPGRWCYSVGPRSRTRGSSPRSLAGAWVLLQGFFRKCAGVRGVSFSRHWQYSSRPRRCHAHVFGLVPHSCIPGGVAVHRAPEPGPV
jgi:hypothetical protein